MEGTPINKYIFPEYSAIILGNESTGISDEVSSLIDERITINRGNGEGRGEEKTIAESLNVSVSSAIICYQLSIHFRQQ